MTHTFDCSIRAASRELQIAAYRMMWPKRCDECKGAGGFAESYDPSPSGVSLSPGSMMMFEPCNWCLEECRCPRCGVKHGAIADDKEPYLVYAGYCVFCDWSEESNATHEPPPYECGCWWELEHVEAAYFDRMTRR